MTDPRVAQSITLAKRLAPLLVDYDPAVQGAVLAQLTAFFVRAQGEDNREKMLEMHIDMVRRLITAPAPGEENEDEDRDRD